MKKTTSKQRLVVEREVVRKLQNSDLIHVQGGVMKSAWICWSDPPPCGMFTTRNG